MGLESEAQEAEEEPYSDATLVRGPNVIGIYSLVYRVNFIYIVDI